MAQTDGAPGGFYLGLDIGGTKCAVICAEADTDGGIRILAREAVKTDVHIPPLDSLARLDALIAPLLAQYPVRAIGVSCGGPLDAARGIIQSPPNLPGWDDVPITAYLEERYRLPSRLQNDANACAYAEWRFGAGRGTSHMVFFTMGTGFGAGLILNGQLYDGANGFAGEIGHIRLSDQGPVGFGKRGSIEGFCSGGGIAQLGKIAALEVLQKGGTCAFCSDYSALSSVTAKTIGDAADLGDKTALGVYAECGAWLGRTCAVVIDLLNPERIVIGSIFARSEQVLRTAMQAAIDREALRAAASVCTVVPAALGEQLGDIAAISVAMLP